MGITNWTDRSIHRVVVLLLTVASTALAVQSPFIDPVIPTSEQQDDVVLAGRPVGYQYRFQVDESKSQITVTAEVFDKVDSNSSPATGWLDATLDVGEEPFSSIHITDMDVELLRDVCLDYWWLFLGSGWACGTDIAVSMDQPGLQTLVYGDGSFLQTANLLAARGTFVYDMPLAGQGELDLAEMDPIQADLEGSLQQNGTTIILQLQIDLEYPLEVEGLGQIGTAWIEGTIVAKAKVFWTVADLNGDDFVDFYDFAVFAPAWLARQGEVNYNPDCDIRDPNDGRIDNLDLALFVHYWLQGLF
jgi:hypothetical protein